MMMTQRTVGDFFRLPMLDQLDIAHTRGRAQVIHDRVGFVESLRGEDMFVGNAFVFVGWGGAVTMKPDVMFPRNLSEFLIIRHVDLSSLYKLPRASCSFSSASNNALKLPLPKLFAPLRWMISKKSVGRSSTGLVKIWSKYPSSSRSTRIPSRFNGSRSSSMWPTRA